MKITDNMIDKQLRFKGKLMNLISSAPSEAQFFEQMCPRAEVSKKAISFLMNSFRYAVEHYFAEQKEIL